MPDISQWTNGPWGEGWPGCCCDDVVDCDCPCLTVKIANISPPDAGAICGDCGSEGTTFCYPFRQSRDADGNILPGRYQPAFSLSAYCGGGDLEDYSLTLYRSGKDVIADVTVSNGGRFVFNLGDDPNCSDIGPTAASSATFPTMDCDFANATATLESDPTCAECGGAIGYSTLFELYGVVDSRTDCGCHDQCTSMNGQTHVLVGPYITNPDYGGDGIHVFGTHGCLYKELTPFGCETNDGACGWYGYHFRVKSLSSGAYSPYTGSITAEYELWLISASTGNTGKQAYFTGSISIPETWMSGVWNRYNEWLRFNPAVLTFAGHVDHDYSYNRVNYEYACDMSSAIALVYMVIGTYSSCGTCSNTFPYSQCRDPSARYLTPYMHEDQEVDVTVTVPGGCSIPEGDYVLPASGCCLSRYHEFNVGGSLVKIAIDFFPRIAGTGYVRAACTGYGEIYVSTGGVTDFMQFGVSVHICYGAVSRVWRDIGVWRDLPFCEGAVTHPDVDPGELPVSYTVNCTVACSPVVVEIG